MGARWQAHDICATLYSVSLGHGVYGGQGAQGGGGTETVYGYGTYDLFFFSHLPLRYRAYK